MSARNKERGPDPAARPSHDPKLRQSDFHARVILADPAAALFVKVKASEA